MHKQTCKNVRAMAPETPITAISGFWRRAVLESCVKLGPRQLHRAPVMLVVELTAILTTVLCFVPDSSVPTFVAAQIALWLWFTVLFANFAEALAEGRGKARADSRSEEHTSELQSLMRISYAVFCLKKKKQTQDTASRE